MKEKQSNKKILIGIIGIIVLVVLCVGMWFIYSKTREKPVEGGKQITVQIESKRDKYSFEQSYNTDEEYLGNFLDKQGLIGFNESEYGRYITSVQGYESNDEEQSWWSISVNGESAMTGVDEIVINDNDVYLLELKIGW